MKLTARLITFIVNFKRVITNKLRSVFVLSFLVLFILSLLTFSYKALATTGVPEILVQQGRLLNSSGDLVGGSSPGTNYCFRFSIYTASSGGTKLWPSGTPSTMTISVVDGIFNAPIGDTSAGGDALDYNFYDNDEVYLNVEVENSSGGSCTGVTFGVEDVLAPRQRIVSSGYAINANTIGGFAPSQAAGANQIPVLDSSGNLVASGALTISSGGSSALTLNSASGEFLLLQVISWALAFPGCRELQPETSGMIPVMENLRLTKEAQRKFFVI